MPLSAPRAPRARRHLALAGLALLWTVVAALQVTPATRAVPGSSSEPTAASFRPVWLDTALADTRSSAAPTADSAPTADEVAPPRSLVETGTAPVPTGRPAVRQPAVAARALVKPIPTSHSIHGRASWYCRAGVSVCMAAHPDRAGVADMYAAAGPGLRRAICGSESSNCWRGRRVLVNGVAVVLADWCACNSRASSVKLIDLYWDAWTRVPAVESGVTIRW
ncbi:MAG TPA: hypothetical protein VFQ75_09375 [Candidatus Limnocylindrales bacterium]|nr:hypothetical protein [Candidatus Limnocylindrales bacterium]